MIMKFITTIELKCSVTVFTPLYTLDWLQIKKKQDGESWEFLNSVHLAGR